MRTTRLRSSWHGGLICSRETSFTIAYLKSISLDLISVKETQKERMTLLKKQFKKLLTFWVTKAMTSAKHVSLLYKMALVLISTTI